MSTESRRIEAFVGDNPATPAMAQQRQNRVLIVAGAAIQANRHRSTAGIHQGGKLGVKSALRPADRLGGLPTHGVGPVLMQLNVRAVEVAKAADRFAGQLGHQPAEQPFAAPSPKPAIYRLPVAKAPRQIAPRTSRPQDKDNPAQCQTLIPGRPPSLTHCANLPSALFLARIRSIFLAAPSAARISTNDLVIARGNRPPSTSLVPLF